MSKTELSLSKQWSNIGARLGKQEFNLANFRSTRDFFMFSTFDPYRFGLIYLRTLIWTLYRSMDARTKSVLHSVPNRNIGKPHSITVDGTTVDLDYAVSAYETNFVLDTARRVKCIVEIGAGYGRTCHTILSNCSKIDSYFIFDLPLMLGICSQYLESVLPSSLFKKVRFVDVTQADAIANCAIAAETLIVNINSLAEMDSSTFHAYRTFIDKKAMFFYSNNTVGKYRPEDVGEIPLRPNDVKDAIRSGPFPQPIDIFDINDISTRTEAYKNAYKPSNDWRVIAEAASPCFPHYHQIIYEKASPQTN